MEKEIMYICQRTSSGQHIVLEADEQALETFLKAVAKPGSQASRDAALMTFANGSEHRDADGNTWYRVEKPITFAPTPTKCHLDGGALGRVAYDAKTKYGGWCIMSERSWREHGCGQLGIGLGQKYLRGSDAQFYLSEGSATRPRAFKRAA